MSIDFGTVLLQARRPLQKMENTNMDTELVEDLRYVIQEGYPSAEIARCILEQQTEELSVTTDGETHAVTAD